MRVFLSYSMNDSEQYIVTIVARRLKEQGNIVSTSYYPNIDVYNFPAAIQIEKSNLFIGIITHTGNDNVRVFTEWRVAREKRIPSLLFVEENIQISSQILQSQNVLVFNRFNSHQAIQMVNQKIEQARNQTVQPQVGNDNSTAWILGGLAALAIIGLLSNKD